MSKVDTEHHAFHSVLRERIVEHVFLGGLLRHLWRMRRFDVEVLRAEFDAGCYDLVVRCGAVIRYIQLKVGRLGGATASVKVSLGLSGRPGGCVIWIVVDDDLNIDHFRWFGDAPESALPGLEALKVARHVKGNAQGEKLERANHRVLPKSRFERIDGFDALSIRLFGVQGGA
ncbi:MAG: hypothetical protein KAG62_15625 [Caulobacter sp.]|nr:hypothetical protein [Caulobacter sp.]